MNEATKHEFDPLSQYCVRCGQAADRIVYYRLPCFAGRNVIAISHRIARRRLEAEFRDCSRYFQEPHS